MASTYSTSLQLQLIATGEQSGIWGTNTNVNWNLIEQAVAGVQSITMTNANYTLTVLNGVSDEARNMVLVVSGTNSAVRDIIAPAASKVYVVYNNTTGGYAIQVKTASGVAVSIPNGSAKIVYCNGTDFFDGVTKIGIGVITSSTGSEVIPVGTTAQRDAVAAAAQSWRHADGFLVRRQLQRAVRRRLRRPLDHPVPRDQPRAQARHH